MELSLIVPIYNEEDIPLLYLAILAAVQPLNLAWEVVLVDDGSRDRSVAELEKLAAADPAPPSYARQCWKSIRNCLADRDYFLESRSYFMLSCKQKSL